MLKGAIEGVTEEVAFGWMYSSAERLRDRLVLAFHDGRCIGAGSIGLYREDLASAGLGDGYLGYHFPIDSPGTDALGEVVLRLDGCDAIFVQRGSRVIGQSTARDLRLSERQLASALHSIKWRVSNRLINQAEYDFLRSFWQFGVYERVIRDRGSAEEPGRNLPRDLAAQMMSVYSLSEVTVESLRINNADAFTAEIARLSKLEDVLPIIGLWSQERASLSLVESSHTVPPNGRAYDTAAQVSYEIRSEQIVFFDIRARSSLKIDRGEVHLFVGRV